MVELVKLYVFFHSLGLCLCLFPSLLCFLLFWSVDCLAVCCSWQLLLACYQTADLGPFSILVFCHVVLLFLNHSPMWQIDC